LANQPRVAATLGFRFQRIDLENSERVREVAPQPFANAFSVKIL